MHRRRLDDDPTNEKTLLPELSAFNKLKAFAQRRAVRTKNDDDQVAIEAPSSSARLVEEVVVTGSRLRRDTFSSVSPLQIITTELSKEAGVIDPAEILQGSTASTGQQIDLTFQGFVLDNGPAASTVNLRGLGASRNLILINGRRVSPSGVRAHLRRQI